MSKSMTTGPLPDRARAWRRFAMRGVKSAGAGVGIAVCLWAMSGDSFELMLVYSLCISTMCWLFIDLGRDLVTSFVPGARRGPSSTRGIWPGWPWMVGIVVVGGLLGYTSGNAIANALMGRNEPSPFNGSSRQIIQLLVLALVPALAITYFFQSREVIATQQAEMEKAQRQAAEQQLKLLESQLEPHMLFNTLANLRALIGIDAARAQAMLDQLIAFLRASLAASRVSVHPLEAEFQRLRDYLALMSIRMGPRLQASFVLPPSLASARVPPLLLQPLVENSIKHGLEPKVEGGRIEVSAALEGSTLVLRVRDGGVGLASDLGGDHYGLEHVRERLRTLYGEQASFSLAVADDAEGGALAVLRLPYETTDRAPMP